MGQIPAQFPSLPFTDAGGVVGRTRLSLGGFAELARVRQVSDSLQSFDSVLPSPAPAGLGLVAPWIGPGRLTQQGVGPHRTRDALLLRLKYLVQVLIEFAV